MIVTKHKEYFALTSERLCTTMRTPIVVDGRNVMSLEGDEVILRTVGKG